jgi:glycosyltransferase involved in cell wall biosynthesis
VTISAVITTFNCGAFLLQALASVRAQTCLPDEIIVIDDGSTDGTREQMEGVPGVRYYWQPNGGTSAARNAGWQQAHSDWVAFLDADDLWLPGKIALQKAAALKDENAEAVFGHAANFASPGTEHLFEAGRHGLEQIRPAWLPSTALVRRSLFERVGGFDERVKTREVVEWILRLRRMDARMVMIPECVLRRRLHGANKGLQDEHGQREIMALVQEWLQHRRARDAGR